jgi:hypothetical protein
MKKFEAQKLVSAIRSIIDNSHFLATMQREKLSLRKTGALAQVRKYLVELVEQCKSADLKICVPSLNRLFILFDEPLSDNAIADSLTEAVNRAIIIVQDELAAHLYFVLEPREAELYNEPWQGWEKIIASFADTTRDIEEMNKCFALARYTASMFHALHVAEWGAIKLGDAIGVTEPKKGWGPTQKKLQAIVDGGHSKLPPHLTGKFEFLEQMNREIHTMMLAWRHKVDHAANHLAIVPNTEFTPEIAEHIIGCVKVFMARLQEGL